MCVLPYSALNGGWGLLYENELNLLCDTLRKCHVKTLVTDLGDPIENIVDTYIEALFGTLTPSMTVRDFIGDIVPGTMYKAVDSFKLSYIYFLLPHTQMKKILFIGPYLSEPLSSRQIFETSESLGISPQNQSYIEQYCTNIPIISSSSHLFVMLDTFCERIWESPSFPIADIDRGHRYPSSPLNEIHSTSNFDDVSLNMKMMETRYKFENELIRAVTLGQIHKEATLFSSINNQAFEKRTTDLLRNSKNYCIIMNTLLRKAAENGGVHPMYVDRVSSSYALKIEQLPAPSASANLMREIFRAYCRLVREHSTNKFSPVVQKTILLIDSNLSSSLSTSTLASSQNISEGYLSTIFKKETGKTVSEYIREKRMEYAIYLLSTTHLQIQTVALYCGIVDVQYFSKIFKKQVGKTPKEYRDFIK